MFCVTAPNTGDSSRSILIPLPYGYVFHLHHWMYCLAIVLLSNGYMRGEPGYDFILRGFPSGGVVHGIIKYSDFYRIVYKYDV